MTCQRSLIVLSAMLLVVAFALAVAGPLDLPLEAMLRRISPELTASLRSGFPAWMAEHIVLPLLARPVWLVPLALGVVFAGGAMTFPPPKPIGRTRTR